MEEMQQCNSSVIHSICRTCLQNLNDIQHDVFQTPNLKRKLILCTSLAVDPGDGLPTSICEPCFLKLDGYYEFRQMCIESMQRCLVLVATEEKQCTIELTIEKDKLEEEILMFPSDKEQPDDDAIYEEIQELVDLEPATPKATGDLPEFEPAIPETFDQEILSSEAVSDDNGDYEESGKNEVGSEPNENGSSNVDSNETQTDSENSNEKPSKSKRTFFVCDICNKRFEKEVMLTAHKRIHAGLKAFPCTECDKSFVKLYRLRVHIRTIHERLDGERLLCPEQGCGRTYALKQTLRKHIKDVHKTNDTNRKQSMYVCEDCGKVLTSLSTLKNHRYRHTGQELPYECPECHKRYVTKHKLKEHRNRHAGIRNYVCPHCGARKATKSELNTHINYHTKEKKYPCNYCEQIFNGMGNLVRHVRIIHKGIKDYRCRYCMLAFGKAETRKHHEMTHTGEKPHECNMCQKTFIQSISLQRHMKNHFKASEIISAALAKVHRSEPTES